MIYTLFAKDWQRAHPVQLRANTSSQEDTSSMGVESAVQAAI